MRILRVALDVPLPQLFDYRAPQGTDHDVGRRVCVPFGSKRVVGVIVEVCDSSVIAPERLRDAETIADDVAPLGREWLALAQFTADYYQRPLGEVILAALPPRLRRPQPLHVAPAAYAITAAGREALAALPARSAAKRAMLGRLAEAPRSSAELTTATVRTLARAGWIAPTTLPAPPARFVDRHTLTVAQQAAVDAITAARGRYQAFLLAGITGSGKTEVYLHAIAEALARGRQVLLLVPEINLTPRLAGELAERFPDTPIVTLTSSVPEAERAERWLAVQRGTARLVLGTRLAVFAPVAELGLVIVDEEHDASFKQQEGVRYSARDLAVFRAHAAGVPVVLGSATPSLESYAHARAGRYALLEIASRAREGAVLPRVEMVDLRAAKAKDGLAEPLATAIEARIARGEQSLLFLNRRGFAPVLACGACGWTAGCPRCAAHLVVHLADRQLRCHHCGLVQPIPRACPSCGNVDLVPFGRGTQRLEDAIVGRFPAARVLRIDSDSTRNKGTWDDMVARIQSGEADILVGTQILAKGHDFPRLTLVGVLNADAALLAADYRAPERLFAQLVQVSGRAGRAEHPGEVLVQTRYPHHPLYQALVRHDYRAFADALLAERRDAGFPPYVFEAVLRADSEKMDHALDFLACALEAAPPRPDALAVFDPVPMSLARVGGRERAHVLLQSDSRRTLQAFLRAWGAALYAIKARDVRWHLDVDPLEF